MGTNLGRMFRLPGSVPGPGRKRSKAHLGALLPMLREWDSLFAQFVELLLNGLKPVAQPFRLGA
jgi:hypothetical protein